MAPRTLKYDQGDLDGLCGIYAVVNALNHLLQNRSESALSESLFEAVLRAIPRRMYPEVLFEGLDVEDLQKIARAAVRHLDQEWNIQVEVTRPFLRRRFKDQLSFLDELETVVGERPCSTVIGIDWNGVEGHWTVLKEIRSDEMRLIDSAGTKVLKRKGTSVRRNGRPRYCPEETTIFVLRGVEGEPV